MSTSTNATTPVIKTPSAGSRAMLCAFLVACATALSPVATLAQSMAQGTTPRLIGGQPSGSSWGGNLGAPSSSGQFEPQQIAASFDLSRALTADIDGDGDLDLITTYAPVGSNSISWSRHLDGLGTFGAPSTIEFGSVKFTGFAAGDLTGDGALDIVYSNDNDLRWRRNLDGLGTFGFEQTVSQGNTPDDVHLVDFDMDGDLDVLGSYAFLPWIRWWQNVDGQGSFGITSHYVLDGLSESRTLAADLDSNGSVDVLGYSDAEDELFWVANINGLGLLGVKQVITTQIDGPRDMDIADVDGDGDLDVLCASIIDDKLSWYENTDGYATFGPQQIVSTALDAVSAVAAADLDGDGDVDLAATSSQTNTVVWLENLDGLGTFGLPTTLTNSLPAASWVDAVDIDLDGDADLLSYSIFQNVVVWFANTLATPSWPYLGDGLAGTHGLPVLTGSGTMASGQLISVDLTNALAGSFATLVVGDGMLGAPFRGGVLVPEPDAIFAGLPLDAAGELTVSATWPPGVPVGAVFWFQYWVIDPAAPVGLSASNAITGTVVP